MTVNRAYILDAKKSHRARRVLKSIAVSRGPLFGFSGFVGRSGGGVHAPRAAQLDARLCNPGADLRADGSGEPEVRAGDGIEKIKTIGDCYMAATGVLDEESKHSPVRVDAMAEIALEMLTTVDTLLRLAREIENEPPRHRAHRDKAQRRKRLIPLLPSVFSLGVL
jgi:hypothetical protein